MTHNSIEELLEAVDGHEWFDAECLPRAVPEVAGSSRPLQGQPQPTMDTLHWGGGGGGGGGCEGVRV